MVEWILLTTMGDVNYIAFVVVVFSQVVSHVQGQVTCGQFQCVPNAFCQNGECFCSGGFIGGGRFLCVQQATRCPCLSFGDPHTVLYDGQRIRTILPCEFTYTTFTTPAVNALSCVVNIRLVTVQRASQSNPFRQFVMELVVTVTRDNTQLDFTAGEGGISTISTTSVGSGTNTDPDITPVLATVGQIRQVTLTECDTTIGFNPTLGSGFVDAPRASAFPPEGLCGNCDGTMNDNPFDAFPNNTQADRDLAFSLRQLSNEQSTNDSVRCVAARTAANTSMCVNDTELMTATRACGVYVIDSAFRDCLLTNGIASKEDLAFTMASCLSLYCSNNVIAACSIIGPLSVPTQNCTVPAGYVCP